MARVDRSSSPAAGRRSGFDPHKASRYGQIVRTSSSFSRWIANRISPRRRSASKRCSESVVMGLLIANLGSSAQLLDRCPRLSAASYHTRVSAAKAADKPSLLSAATSDSQQQALLQSPGHVAAGRARSGFNLTFLVSTLYDAPSVRRLPRKYKIYKI